MVNRLGAADLPIRQCIRDNSCKAWPTNVLQEADFASVNRYSWSFFQQYIFSFVRFYQLVKHYTFLSPHTHSKTLRPGIFSFGVDMDGSPGLTSDCSWLRLAQQIYSQNTIQKTLFFPYCDVETVRSGIFSQFAWQAFFFSILFGSFLLHVNGQKKFLHQLLSVRKSFASLG